MTEDEMALLLRSYGEQAVRGLEPSPRIEVDTDLDDQGVIACIAFDICDGKPTLESVATLAADAAVRLIYEDESISVDEAFAADGKVWVSVSDSPKQPSARFISVRELIAMWEDENQADELPPAEEAELAGALEMPTGRLESGLPVGELVVGRPTKLMVVGLNLAGRGWAGEVYHFGELGDPDRAQYWAGKHERNHAARGFRAVTSVVWQSAEDQTEMLRRVMKSLNR